MVVLPSTSEYTQKTCSCKRHDRLFGNPTAICAAAELLESMREDIQDRIEKVRLDVVSALQITASARAQLTPCNVRRRREQI